MSQIKKVDHIAIACHKLDEGLRIFDALGLKPTRFEDLPKRGIRIAFIEIGPVTIEVMEPMNDQSEIARFLEKRGPGIHHIALQCGYLDETIEKVQNLGFRPTSPMAEGGAHGMRVNFINPKDTGGVLLELVEHSRSKS